MLYISDEAKDQVDAIRADQEMTDKDFIRISVEGGGCSGLSYKMDFDDKLQPEDQEFMDKGIKMVTDLKSFLYVCNSTLEYSEGLKGKGFHFVNPNASRTCACGESFAV